MHLRSQALLPDVLDFVDADDLELRGSKARFKTTGGCHTPRLVRLGPWTQRAIRRSSALPLSRREEEAKDDLQEHRQEQAGHPWYLWQAQSWKWRMKLINKQWKAEKMKELTGVAERETIWSRGPRQTTLTPPKI